MRKEIYISVDIEASGPTPATQSLLSIGACVVGNHDQQFYTEVKPLWNPQHHKPDKKAMEVNGLNILDLWLNAPRPEEAMGRFVSWVKTVSNECRPVFVSFGTFDWMWTGFYLDAYTHAYTKPFGPNTLDLKSFYMGWRGNCWRDTAKGNMPKMHVLPGKHTHNALEDAIEQARMFERWLVEMWLTSYLKDENLCELARREYGKDE